MMTPEQRQLAEEIADYVRREVREVGLLMERLDGAERPEWPSAWRLAWKDEHGDAHIWISPAGGVSWDAPGGRSSEMARCVFVDGIPDLSDDATVDALLRHLLLRRRWTILREDMQASAYRSARFHSEWVAFLGTRPVVDLVTDAIKEEANHETL